MLEHIESSQELNHLGMNSCIYLSRYEDELYIQISKCLKYTY